MDNKLTGSGHTSWLAHFRERQQLIRLTVEQVIQHVCSMAIMLKNEGINLFPVF